MSRHVCRLFKGGNLYILCSPIFEMAVEQSISSKIRLYSTPPVRKLELEAPTYTKTDEYKTTKKNVVKTLENLLGIRTFKALEIISNNKIFHKVDSATMKSNQAYLQKFISNETLLKHPELLALTKVEAKLPEIQKLPYDVDIVAVLLLIPPTTLTNFVYNELQTSKDEGKIARMSKLLKRSEEQVCEFIAKKTFLCSLPTEKLEANIKLLTDFGISLEDIRNDLWVLKYSEKTIKSRLSDAKRHNIETMKTWMVRAQPEIFQTYIQRRSDKKSILGNSSLTEYLSERLECSPDVSNHLILKQPALKNKSLKKLKELIDFLYAVGFKPYHICRIPKILVHSEDTIRKRLKQLEDKGIQIDSLHMLTKSQKQFTQYYEALLKSKKIKN